jgi:hypothetical protein
MSQSSSQINTGDRRAVPLRPPNKNTWYRAEYLGRTRADAVDACLAFLPAVKSVDGEQPKRPTLPVLALVQVGALPSALRLLWRAPKGVALPKKSVFNLPVDAVRQASDVLCVTPSDRPIKVISASVTDAEEDNDQPHGGVSAEGR